MRTILITGVSRGLGLIITRNLLENKFKVIGLARTKTDDVSNLVSEFADSFSFIKFDLADPAASEILFKNEIIRDKVIFGFVNNAAIAYDDLITNAKTEPLTNMFQVNVLSPIIITRQVLRNMLLHNTKGSIVHISSISVHTGYKGLGMYAATKGAIEAFSKNAAREWGELGIRSNTVVSGFMETEMSSSLSSDQKNRIYKRTSLKAPTSTLSVASTVRFLLTEDSSSITGQNIFVDSGTI